MKTLSKMTAVLVTAALCTVGIVSTGHASTLIGGLQAGTTGYYDYSANAVRDVAAGTETTIWCGDNPSKLGDTILEQQNLLSNWSIDVPERMAFAEGPAGAWDETLTCNPSNVIKGSFPNVLGDGVTYTYVIYYVGYSNTTQVNQIGAAFSTDSLNWHKYPTPVEAYSSCGCYGLAQPSAVSLAGSVNLAYEESNHGATNRVATSVDGVHFAPSQVVSATGLPDTSTSGDPSATPFWGAVSFNSQNGNWYALFNDGWRPASQTGGTQENADGGCTLYSTADIVNGTWTRLDTIDTNLTGSESNFMCGFVRDPDGTLSSFFLPNIKILVSTSWPRPAYNATVSQIQQTSVFNNWQIFWHEYVPGNPWRSLQRLVHGGGNHEVTTGWSDTSAYHLESTLGKLAEAPTGDANVPWYGCKTGTLVYFVSLNSNCEGQYRLGLEGYSYSTSAADRVALYRCVVVSTNDHFVSSNPNCEGQRTESLLGYAQS